MEIVVVGRSAEGGSAAVAIVAAKEEGAVWTSFHPWLVRDGPFAADPSSACAASSAPTIVVLSENGSAAWAAIDASRLVTDAASPCWRSIARARSAATDAVRIEADASADDAAEAGAFTGATPTATLSPVDAAGEPAWFAVEDAWTPGGVSVLWLSAPGPEAEDAVSDEERDAGVDDVPVAGLIDGSSPEGSAAPLPPDGRVVSEEDEDELDEVAVVCVVPFDDRPSRADGLAAAVDASAEDEPPSDDG